MKCVLVITDVPFWIGGTGNRERIYKLVTYLSLQFKVTIAFAGFANLKNLQKFGLGDRVQFYPLGKTKESRPSDFAERLKAFVLSQSFHTCIIEYVHNSYLLNYLPPTIFRILDMHDITYERTSQFHIHNRIDPFANISREMELELMSYYDLLLCICEPDYKTLSAHFSINKLVLVPHAPAIKKRVPSQIVEHIGFLASDYSPNIDGITYFINTIWPYISRTHRVQLDIYGNVCKYLTKLEIPDSINLHGYIEDKELFYGCVDIVVNPVQYGAGMKIKNLEAIANSLPLVTTTHGARGIENAVNRGFLLASNDTEFRDSLEHLLQDPLLRSQLATGGIEYVYDNFTPDKCYSKVAQLISLT